MFGEVDCSGSAGAVGSGSRMDQRLDGGGSPPARPPRAAAGPQGIIQAGNLAGLPALVLLAASPTSLPVALQLVGPPFSENTLLAVGQEFQARTDWHKRRPPGV